MVNWLNSGTITFKALVNNDLHLASGGDLLKLCRLNDIQDLLQLVEEHHLFWAVHFWPVPGGSHHIEMKKISEIKNNTDRSRDMITGSVRLGSFSRN